MTLEALREQSQGPKGNEPHILLNPNEITFPCMELSHINRKSCRSVPKISGFYTSLKKYNFT